MKKFLFLLVAGFVFFSCSNKESSATEADAVETPNRIAEHVSIGNLFYDLYDNKTAEVVKDDNYFYTLSGTLTIPSTVNHNSEEYSVTDIGHCAFSCCTRLTSVTLPNGMKNIGYSAFKSCTGLTAISIPNSVTAIGDGAFSGCYSLKSITIPDGVTRIGNYTFAECNDLESITIPNSVTDLAENAFEDCYRINVLRPNGEKYYDEDEPVNDFEYEDGYLPPPPPPAERLMRNLW